MEKNIYELKLTDQFSNVDGDFKKALKDLCCEIDRFDTDCLSVVSLLKKLPYELAMVIVDNLKYDKEGYIGLLNSIYYDEFKLDVINKDENKKRKFENRLISQKLQNFETFAIERLLTIGEIENLINIFIEESKQDITKEDVISGKIIIDDKNLKILAKAHKFLSKRQNAKINQEIFCKMEKFWLNLTIDYLIKDKEKKGINV